MTLPLLRKLKQDTAEMNKTGESSTHYEPDPDCSPLPDDDLRFDIRPGHT
jgi:hypothetical protein